MDKKKNNVNKTISLHKFAEYAYLNYSIYVITDRALPHIGDGLKPVQRRVIYAMSELGLKSISKFKKSARTIGDVIGKYHPHGDVACYEAMVLMAQSFSYRYPLIEGQGNWGTPDDPKSFAAMRYTESRLSKYSDLLLNEIEQGTVDYIPNFDGTLLEPKILPACLPNIILNGANGIAVGMATDIPPHNIKEVADAIIKLIDNPKITLKDILNIIQGPDFPTGSEIITPKKEIFKIYENGKGSIRLRAVWHTINNNIIITALPHQVSGIRIIEQINTHIRNKKLPMIEEVRDESDYENPTRIVIIIRNNFNYLNIEDIMYHLFCITDLEKSYRINLNMIGLNNKPAVKNLLEILNEWITFRRIIIKRRLNFYLKKLKKKLHIIKGLLIVYLNLTEFINIIRFNDNPAQIIKHKFNFSELQIETLLNFKLRSISLLEEQKLLNEQKKLIIKFNNIQKTLISAKKLNVLLKKEILLATTFYSNKRRSLLKESKEAKILNDNQLVTDEPITIILSKMGWIRCAKGHTIDPSNLNYKSGDNFFLSVKGKKNQIIAMIDSKGRSYSIDPNSLPPARSQGEPLNGKIYIPEGSTIKYLIMESLDTQILLFTNAGYGFICKFRDLIASNRNGKLLIILTENAQILSPLIINNIYIYILIISSTGKLLLLSIKDIPLLSKGRGNKLITIDKKSFINKFEQVKWIYLINQQSIVYIHTSTNIFKLNFKDLKKFHSNRGHTGFSLNKYNINNIIHNTYIKE
ncbi:DNA topoisomerase IV subunit A [Enterobacteriaceae endosymbiont of Neohaemonia nigricornis]|uniref:DNA topoisomerase IV subunit A n=1 Tax=Enterobacteriaceae endosymbiont of Neohaemonia nigricornis TaxID=2675792 RepID=UPI001449A67F|nr:DNA topoisomerase IV subunit A [Enterobacteriaceae endosymbiont of Neohaemonia nigricornis]QJC30558.1 DNA topoisomerase IV subunit A [Enterobacteriaceae endosymbiont of Neohaemonia nigricornis]